MARIFARGECPPSKTMIDKLIKQLDAIEKDVDSLAALVAGRGKATKNRIAKAREILDKI